MGFGFDVGVFIRFGLDSVKITRLGLFVRVIWVHVFVLFHTFNFLKISWKVSVFWVIWCVGNFVNVMWTDHKRH